jgi:hypothetical protein
MFINRFFKYFVNRDFSNFKRNRNSNTIPKNRQLLTKFRLNDHNLEIELGRYKNIPRNQRHCKFGNTLDDEFHFFFDCKVTDNIRPSFIIGHAKMPLF